MRRRLGERSSPLTVPCSIAAALRAASVSLQDDGEEWPAALAGATGLLVNSTIPIDAELVAAARALRIVATASKGHDFEADKLKATTTPMFFIHGDADGVRLAHIAEMFRLKGGEIHGDLKPRSASRLAILPDTTHVTLMQRIPIIVPMVNDFLDAKP